MPIRHSHLPIHEGPLETQSEEFRIALQPPPAEFVDALKKAHPQLTDEIVQEYHVLVQAGLGIDPEREPAEFSANRKKIVELKRTHMPKYDEVWKDYCSKIRQARLDILGASSEQGSQNVA